MPELLATDALTRHFKIGGALSRQTLHAVDDVYISIGEREIVALAGESGSGKSTVARGARPGVPADVRVGDLRRRAAGENPVPAGRAALQRPGPHGVPGPVQLDQPGLPVSHGMLRALKLHRPELSAAQRRAEAARVFQVVGLSADKLDAYPHELSGGQRQRVGFAQALVTKPKLILADEPVSMLDVSVRIGLLNLMIKLRDEEGVSILYITHDIASARYVADRLIVMYAGQVAESGPIEDVLADPRHPYTQAVSNVPDPKAPAPLSPEGGSPGASEPPKVVDPAPGCRFRPRCPVAIDVCATVTPPLLPFQADGPAREAACHVAHAVPPLQPHVRSAGETQP